jgi:ribose-phosphate pyrophosphokinase
MNIIGEVRDKNVILYDDMVDTAGSLCGAAKALVELGKAKDIYACATHGVLSGQAIERINESYLKELIFTDTIPYPGVTPSSKIKYLSAAPLFAEAIERVYEEVSISTLFR